MFTLCLICEAIALIVSVIAVVCIGRGNRLIYFIYCLFLNLLFGSLILLVLYLAP